jgi:hypothetical protein
MILVGPNTASPGRHYRQKKHAYDKQSCHTGALLSKKKFASGSRNPAGQMELSWHQSRPRYYPGLANLTLGDEGCVDLDRVFGRGRSEEKDYGIEDALEKKPPLMRLAPLMEHATQSTEDDESRRTVAMRRG